jgi:hypothetical protein
MRSRPVALAFLTCSIALVATGHAVAVEPSPHFYTSVESPAYLAKFHEVQRRCNDGPAGVELGARHYPSVHASLGFNGYIPARKRTKNRYAILTLSRPGANTLEAARGAQQTATWSYRKGWGFCAMLVQTESAGWYFPEPKTRTAAGGHYRDPYTIFEDSGRYLSHGVMACCPSDRSSTATSPTSQSFAACGWCDGRGRS